MFLSQLEVKKHIIGIFIGLSMAFDTIKHSICINFKIQIVISNNNNVFKNHS